MCEIAEKLGWPERFQDDLYKWDKQILDNMKDPKQTFLWSIYESGTHMFISGWKDGVGHTGADMMPVLERCFPTCQHHWWDGVALHHLTSGIDEAIELLRRDPERKVA